MSNVLYCRRRHSHFLFVLFLVLSYLWETATGLIYYCSVISNLIVANCHSHMLLLDLTAWLTKQWETTIVSFILQHYCQLIWKLRRDCHLIVATCHVAASSPTYSDCGVIANLLWQIATSPLLWDLSACAINLSSQIQGNKLLVLNQDPKHATGAFLGV